MGNKKPDLILHPVRLRILQTLVNDTLNTQQIANRLPDIAKSSIYRHLKLLLENEMIDVEDSRMVKGIEEKRYRLSQSPHLTAEDLANADADKHLQYFTTFMLSMLRDFGNYLNATEANEGKIDLLKDLSGYTEVSFYANEKELQRVFSAINQAILPLMNNREENGRFKHKLSTITHPLRTKDVQPPVGGRGKKEEADE